MRVVAGIGIPVILTICAGCGAPEEHGSTHPPAVATLADRAGQTEPAPRDLSAVDGCATVTGQEVVEIAGAAKLASPPAPIPAGCMYVVELNGGAGEGYQFRYDGTGMQKLLIEHLEPAENMRKIEGPWEDARIGPQPLGAGTRMIVVLDALGIELSGDRPEPLIEIAKLAAARAP